MCFRIGGLVLLGGVTSLVVEHSDWFQTATQQQTAAPQPSPTPATTPTPKPSAAKLAAAPLPAHATTTPPGWTNFMGILIPPPGYNDHQ